MLKQSHVVIMMSCPSKEMLCPSVVGIKILCTFTVKLLCTCLKVYTRFMFVYFFHRNITDLAIFENVFLLLRCSGSVQAR